MKLFINIGKLYSVYPEAPGLKCGKEMDVVPHITNAWMAVEGGYISSFGGAEDVQPQGDFEIIDCGGCHITPTFIDSHTHLVYAASREEEFAMRLRGKTYEEIAAAGGGILNSARKMQDASQEQLLHDLIGRVVRLVYMGTAAFEIKSGYGLTLESEVKMLRVIQELKNLYPEISIRSTFLGAHAVPRGIEKEQYIKTLIDEWLPAIEAEDLADYCDVFCDRGYFTQAEAEKILNAAKEYDLLPRIHANELGNTGGVEAAIATGCISADHLEQITDYEIGLLASSSVIPTILPGTSYYLGLPYAPVRAMIQAGLPVVVASDCNPGSSPSGNPVLLMSLACTQLKMSVEEAFNAMTINAAHALNWEDTMGAFWVGAKANFILLQENYTLNTIPYYYGSGPFGSVFLGGEIFQ